MMTPSRLRVCQGSEAQPPAEGGSTADVATVNVTLWQILPTLVEAALRQRAWLDDFADEELTISRDLWQVILACQHYRQASA